MSSFLRRHAGLISVAVLSLTLGLSAPAIGHGVNHALFAHNADKVDGKHAVGAGASVANRKGKLVATSPTTGRLPDNIIAKAPNADKVDGIDSRQLQFPSTVPLGTTLVGRWGFDADADADGFGDWGASISYPVPMPTSLPVEIVPSGPTETCPGTAGEPTATPGRLCVYVTFRTGTLATPTAFGTTRFGTGLLLSDDGTAGDIYAYGTWAAKPGAPMSARAVPGDVEKKG